jgi:hypothetical protein
MIPDIVINSDEVVIEGVVVPRPKNMARSSWIAFWERAVETDREEARRFRDEYNYGSH